ncbi:MAG: hypothetical protein JKY67_17480 [Pseudomonadales bacterium]|nr:hypothetical protein [Pseudomonadales bacterium]
MELRDESNREVMGVVGLSVVDNNGKPSERFRASIDLIREKCDRGRTCKMNLSIFTETWSQQIRGVKPLETITLNWGEVIVAKRHENGRVYYFSEEHNLMIGATDVAYLGDIKSVYTELVGECCGVE